MDSKIFNLKVILCAALHFNFFKTIHCEDWSSYPPTCFSEIYCHGRLLDTIQMAKIYEDSKTFVDMKMKKLPNETLEIFDEFMKKYPDSKPNRAAVSRFVHENFEEAGQEFEYWNPVDWIEYPKYIHNIKDEGFKEWAVNLNTIWKDLGRKMKLDVEQNKELYSIIWVPNPVIVPGGRFREFYYWDTYWILHGLLLSEMHKTVKGILQNFLYIVDTYGHIPNGGRIYYLARSQPPLLVPMIKSYVEYSHDEEFIAKNIETMEKEFTYWLTNHAMVINKDGKNYTLAIYGDKSQGPRPESYSEDIEGAQIFKDNNKKEAFYAELKAAAESGWDFSSRWFITNGTNKGNLTNIKTRSIVPVDLNAVLYWNAVILAEFYEKLGNESKVEYYKNVAAKWLEAVEAVLWHEEVGVWLDYDFSNSIKRDYFYPTNIAPLWTGCYNQSGIEKRVNLILKYLQNKNIMNYPGGIPTTVEHTGEQWDYPNAWPPLQHIMIVGLNNTGITPAVRLAHEIAEKWVRSNYKAFQDSNAMYEKYDSTVMGGHGGGGEYELQTGFGWTNGIIMELLYKYSDKITADDPPSSLAPSLADTQVASSPLTTALIALVVSLTAGFIGVCIYKHRTRQQPAFEKKRPSTARYKELRNIPRYSKSVS